jgi:nitrogen fixation protein
MRKNQRPLAEFSMTQLFFAVIMACGISLAAGTVLPVIAAQTGKQPAPGYVPFPNAGLRLARPTGFDTASSFDGFQQPQSGASVALLRVPGPYAEVTRKFDAATLKTGGMTLRGKKPVKIDGLPGVLLNVAQTANGIAFSKWIVAFGDSRQTFLITASFPQARAAQLSQPLRTAVLSAKRDNSVLPPADAGLPFTVNAGKKLKLTRSMGKMLLYTKDGVIPAKSLEDPLLVVAPSMGDIVVSDRKEYSLKRLQQTAKLTNITVESHEPLRVDAWEGFESVAKAKDATTGTPLTLYQAMLFEGNSYILFQGIVGEKESAAYLQEFMAAARNIKRKSSR